MPDTGGVRFVEVDEGRKHAPEVHRRRCAITPGAVARRELWWDGLMRGREFRRRDASALFHLVHSDGYASWRVHRDDERARCS